MGTHPERDGRRCHMCGIDHRQGARSPGLECPVCEARRQRERLEREVEQLEATIESLRATVADLAAEVAGGHDRGDAADTAEPEGADVPGGDGA